MLARPQDISLAVSHAPSTMAMDAQKKSRWSAQPAKSRQLKPLSMKSYKDYVEVQCSCNPCLLNLRELLSDRATDCTRCRISSVTFYPGRDRPVIQTVDPSQLHYVLMQVREKHYQPSRRSSSVEPSYSKHAWEKDSPELHSQSWTGIEESDLAEPAEPVGEILIIEDLTPDIVEVLGSSFGIDPLFFASHIHTATRRATSQTPDMATLPSRTRPNEYINTLYHRCAVFENTSYTNRSLRRNMNVHRKVTVLPLSDSTNVGLVQHGMSIYKKTLPDGYWFGK